MTGSTHTMNIVYCITFATDLQSLRTVSHRITDYQAPLLLFLRIFLSTADPQG